MSESIFKQNKNKDLSLPGLSNTGCNELNVGPTGNKRGVDCIDNINEKNNPDLKIKEGNVLKEDFFTKAYSSLCRMQQAKDARYGNSALKPLEIFSKHHPYGSRIDEKLARIKHSDELRKNDVADIIGGLMLLCQEKGWDYFEDLID